MTVAGTQNGASDQAGSPAMQRSENELWDSLHRTAETQEGVTTSGGLVEASGVALQAGVAFQGLHAPVARRSPPVEEAQGLENRAQDEGSLPALAGLEAGPIAVAPDALLAQQVPPDLNSDHSQSRPVATVHNPKSGPVSPLRVPPAHADRSLAVEPHEASFAAQSIDGHTPGRARNLTIDASRESVEEPSLSAEVPSPASLPDSGDFDDGGGSGLRPATRRGGSYKAPEIPLGLVSPRAGVTSTAVLALSAPDRPSPTGVRRRKGTQGARSFKARRVFGQSVSAGLAQVALELNRQSDLEGEGSGSGLLEGGASGRSGTTSGGKVLRECSVCHLNKSPRWRTGPEGPKTLCNRCGVYWSQNRHKWDELVDRFKATSDGEVNQLQAEFKAVRYAKNADLEQRRAKVVRQAAPKVQSQGLGALAGGHRPRKASNLGRHSRSEGHGQHSRSDTETILRKLQELPGHFAKSLRKELLGFGLVRSASPNPGLSGGQPGPQAEVADEEVVISSGSDDEAAHVHGRSSQGGASGIPRDALTQEKGSSNNLGSAAFAAGAFGVPPASGFSFPGEGHPGENKAKRKRSETKVIRDSLTQAGGKKARLVPGESATEEGSERAERAEPKTVRKEEDVIKEAEELLRKGGLGGSSQRGGNVGGHFVGGKKIGGQRSVKVTERKALFHGARLERKPSNSVGIVINSSGLAKIKIGGVTRLVPKGEVPELQVDRYGVPIPKKKGPGRPPSAAKLAARLEAGGRPVVDLSGKMHLKVDLPGGGASLPVEGTPVEGPTPTPTVRSARIKARGPAPDFSDMLDDEEDEETEVPRARKQRRARPAAGKMALLENLPDMRYEGQKYKGAKRGRKPKNWNGEVKPPRKRGRPPVEFTSKLEEFEKVFKPSVRRTKRPRLPGKELRTSVDFGSPSGEFPLVPDSLLSPTFPPVPELLLPSRLQKTRALSPVLGSIKPRLPMQVDDITVESFGSVDPHHITVETGRICAIGYRSTWKDPTLGLVHVSEVIAGEDGKPIYTVTCRLKERTDEEERSLGGGLSPFARSHSVQVQRSPRSPIQRSFSLQDGRFRLSAPSPLGQSQQSAFTQAQSAITQTRGVEQRPSGLVTEEERPVEGEDPVSAVNTAVPEEKEVSPPAAQGWEEGAILPTVPTETQLAEAQPSAEASLSPPPPEKPVMAPAPQRVEMSPPLDDIKQLGGLRKEPTISPLLVGKPGPPIEALKGFDGAADLHDLDTAMIWDEDFHVAFGDVEQGASVGAFGGGLGEPGRKSDGHELGWGFGLGTEQDKGQGSLWDGHGHVSEQEAEEGMLAVFRGPGEGTRMELSPEESPRAEPTGEGAQFLGEEMAFGGSDPLRKFPPVEKDSPPSAPAMPAVQEGATDPPTLPRHPISLNPVNLNPADVELPPLAAPLHINTHVASEQLEPPPTSAEQTHPPSEAELPRNPRRPGRPRRADAKALPVVSIPDRQLRSEKQSQGVETPRTAHRRLTGSDLLVKRSSPEEAWRAYAAAWRETFEARAPQHVEEIDWDEFERDHFGLEKAEVVQWIADLFQASPRLTQARRSFQNLQLMQHGGPGPSLLQPAPKQEADRPATRAEEKDAMDEAARAKRQLAEGMRRQLLLFSDSGEKKAKDEKSEGLVLEGVSVQEVQETLQVFEQLGSVPGLHLPPLNVFLDGLIHPAPSADSLIDSEGIVREKAKPKGPATAANLPTTAATTSAPAVTAPAPAVKELEASEAVADLHLQLVRLAAANLGPETQKPPKLFLRLERSPGPVTTPVADASPATPGEVTEAAVPTGPLPQTPRPGDEASPSGAFSDSGEKIPARVSTRAPKWKAGLTNGEAPWALLMSRNMAKAEKEAGGEAHHEGLPFRQGLELLDGLTWPAFARRILEEEVKPPEETVKALEETATGLEGQKEGALPKLALPAPDSHAVAEGSGEGAAGGLETGPEEDPVPLPIILTPAEIVRRAEREAAVVAEAERQLARAAALLKGHEGTVTEFTAPVLDIGGAPSGVREPAAPTPVSSELQSGAEATEPLERYDFWWSPLEGLGPMNSNQGSKIRGRIQAALGMRPPQWARSDLEKVITRDVYRSSAGGPMKRMAISVLERAHQIQADSEKPSLTQFTTTKLCREVIRLVAEQDDVKVFSNLPDEAEERYSLEGVRIRTEPYKVWTKGFRVLAGDKRGLKRTHDEVASEEVPCGYIRTMDLRTIDMRLAARAYGGSLELFLADVRTVWDNARQQYPAESKEVKTAEELSDLFNRLYQEKVLHLGPDGLPLPKPSSRPPKDLTIRISDPVWGRLPKAPWEWEGCKVCGIDENDDQVLLCDQCSAEYHTYCLDPPLARIPEGDWLCHNCKESRPPPVVSPTIGRPGRKKGSGKIRTADGRRVKVRIRGAPRRPESSDGGAERKKRGRPLSAKGAERRANEEKTAERRAINRVYRENVASPGAFRMERFSGVLALEAPESPAMRLARLGTDAGGTAVGPTAPPAVEAAKPPLETRAEYGVKAAEETNPPEASNLIAEPGVASSVGVVVPVKIEETATAVVGASPKRAEEDVKPGPSTNEAAPAGDVRTLRSKGGPTPERREKKVKRKGQNQYTKRKELAELAAKLAAGGKPAEAGEAAPEQKSAAEGQLAEGEKPAAEAVTATEDAPRKGQNQYTKRKELALAAAKSGKPLRGATSSPGLRLKTGVRVATRVQVGLSAKTKMPLRGSPEGKGLKQLPRVEGKGNVTKVEKRAPLKKGQNQLVKKEGGEPAVVEIKRKGENQYTKAKRLAEEAQKEKEQKEKEKRKGENQYTKAKRLAEEAAAKKLEEGGKDGEPEKAVEVTEVKRKGENQYTKAKRLAEEAERAKQERKAAKERRKAEREKKLAEQGGAKKAGEQGGGKKVGEQSAGKKSPEQGLGKKVATKKNPDQSGGKNAAGKTGGKKGAEPVVQKKRKRENQYTKAKRLAAEAEAAAAAAGEVKAVAKAEKRAEGKVKTEVKAKPDLNAAGEIKRRGENQYTKAKRLAEEAAKEKRREQRREKRKGENQYTKAKKLALLALEAARGGKTEEGVAGGAETGVLDPPASSEKPVEAGGQPTGKALIADPSQPESYPAELTSKPGEVALKPGELATKPEEKPARRRENQYTKRKRLAEQGIELKAAKAEPRSGLRSKGPETPLAGTLQSEEKDQIPETPKSAKQEKGTDGEPAVYYTRRKSARGEAKAADPQTGGPQSPETKGGEAEKTGSATPAGETLQPVKAEPHDAAPENVQPVSDSPSVENTLETRIEPLGGGPNQAPLGGVETERPSVEQVGGEVQREVQGEVQTGGGLEVVVSTAQDSGSDGATPMEVEPGVPAPTGKTSSLVVPEKTGAGASAEEVAERADGAPAGDAAQADVSNAGPGQADISKVEAGQADVSRVEAASAEVSKVETAQAGVSKVETAQADISKVDAAPADVSKVLEGRPAKRQRLLAREGKSQPGASGLRPVPGGEKRERRAPLKRGLTVRVMEPPKPKAEKTAEEKLADRVGECAYWELTMSERLQLFKALAKRAADVAPLPDSSEQPVNLGSDVTGTQYWVVTCSTGPLLLTGTPAKPAPVPAPVTQQPAPSPEGGPLPQAIQPPGESNPNAEAPIPLDAEEPLGGPAVPGVNPPEEVAIEPQLKEGEERSGPGGDGLTLSAPEAGPKTVQEEAVSMDEDREAAGEGVMDTDSKAVPEEIKVPEGGSEPGGEGTSLGEKVGPEHAVAAESEAVGGNAKGSGAMAESSSAEQQKDETADVLRKGTWSIVASAEALDGVRAVLTSAQENVTSVSDGVTSAGGENAAEEASLAGKFDAWDARLRQGLDGVSGKRSVDDDEGPFTSRKKQKLPEEEAALSQPLRAAELLTERERSPDGKAFPRCLCGEPFVLARVHCPYCHCSAEKGRGHAFSHWCDRPHGCLLLEDSRLGRLEASPATGPFGLPAGAETLEESQADLEVLERLELDLQAFADGLDYPGLGGAASAPFTSLARSPPQRVALNRVNRSPNPPASELGPPAVPLTDGFYKRQAVTSPKPDSAPLHAQSFTPFSAPPNSQTPKPPNPVEASPDAGALVPCVPPVADVSGSGPVPETPRPTDIVPGENSKIGRGALLAGQHPALARLKMDLLDVEAALGPNSLGGVRATPERCNAWRVMVKTAGSAKELAYAAVLLELMVRPALIAKEWAAVGPLSRAVADGRGETYAQVALMIHSLDGVIDYEGLQSAKESSKRKRVR